MLHTLPMHSLLLALVLIAIPSFLLGPIVSMFLPMVVNSLVSWIAAMLKRETTWQVTVSPLYGHAINLVVSFLVTTVLVKTGVGIDAGTLNCINDAATTNTLSCLQTQDISAVLTFIVSLVSGHISSVALVEHADFKAKVGRYAR